MILASHGIIGSSIVQFSPQIAADAFYARVTDAGGSLTATEESAILDLITDLVEDGLWDKMKAIYPMVGASAAACAQNLKSSSFTGTFTATGWTFASTGVTPNGTSAFFNTDFNPNANLSKDSSHMSYYSRTDNNGGLIDMGVEGTAPTRLIMHIKFSGVAYYDQNDQGAGRLSFSMLTQKSACFSLMSRTAINLQIGQINGVTKGTNIGTNISQLPNDVVYIGKINNANFYTNRQCAFASIGDGLTDTEASDFYTAVQAFQTTLNREIAP
jgi:hypothetical protein